MGENKILLFDLETEGLANDSRIVEYYFEDFDTGNQVFHEYVESSIGCPIDNGLTSKFLSTHGKSHEEVRNHLNHILAQYKYPTLCCFSSHCDKDLQWLIHNGINVQKCRYININKNIQEKGSLETLFQKYIDPNYVQKHTAADDVWMMRKIIEHFKIQLRR